MAKEGVCMKDNQSGEDVIVNIEIDCLKISFLSSYKDEEEPEILRSQQILATTIESHDTDVYSDLTSINIYYAMVLSGTHDTVSLQKSVLTLSASRHLCEYLANCIENLLKRNEGHRVQKVLMFVNPICGSGQAVSQYYDIVKPLFDLCGINADVVITKERQEPSLVLKDYDIETVNAVICMGGDGTVRDVVTGMLQKSAKNARLDDTASVVKPILPLGVIPSGTVNVVSVYTNCVKNSIESAVISIIMGRTTPYDVTAIKQNGKIVNFSCIWSSVGCMSPVAWLLEKLRFLGKLRMVCMLPLLWLMFRLNDVEIQYRPVPQSQRELKINPSSQKEHLSSADDDDPISGWKTFHGKICDIVMIPWMQIGAWCYCVLGKMQPAYKKPNVSCGKWLLVIDKTKSIWQKLKFFDKDKRSDRENIPADMIEQIEVTECKIKATGKWSAWDLHLIDGDSLEVQHGVDCHMKVVSNALDVFCMDDNIVSDFRKQNHESTYTKNGAVH